MKASGIVATVAAVTVAGPKRQPSRSPARSGSGMARSQFVRPAETGSDELLEHLLLSHFAAAFQV
jgi:hypothetical protein